MTRLLQYDAHDAKGSADLFEGVRLVMCTPCEPVWRNCVIGYLFAHPECRDDDCP
jgi:hypothetical protein